MSMQIINFKNLGAEGGNGGGGGGGALGKLCTHLALYHSFFVDKLFFFTSVQILSKCLAEKLGDISKHYK